MINKARYSIGLQSLIKGLFHVPQEFVNHQNPLRYNPIDHLDYLDRFFGKDNSLKKSPCAIKAYAGVN